MVRSACERARCINECVKQALVLAQRALVEAHAQFRLCVNAKLAAVRA